MKFRNESGEAVAAASALELHSVDFDDSSAILSYGHAAHIQTMMGDKDASFCWHPISMILATARCHRRDDLDTPADTGAETAWPAFDKAFRIVRLLCRCLSVFSKCLMPASMPSRPPD